MQWAKLWQNAVKPELMEYQLDLTHYHCPLPLLMAQQAIKSLEAGDKLLLILSPQTAVNDFLLLEKPLNCQVKQLSQTTDQYALQVELLTS